MLRAWAGRLALGQLGEIGTGFYLFEDLVGLLLGVFLLLGAGTRIDSDQDVARAHRFRLAERLGMLVVEGFQLCIGDLDFRHDLVLDECVDHEPAFELFTQPIRGDALFCERVVPFLFARRTGLDESELLVDLPIEIGDVLIFRKLIQEFGADQVLRCGLLDDLALIGSDGVRGAHPGQQGESIAIQLCTRDRDAVDLDDDIRGIVGGSQGFAGRHRHRSRPRSIGFGSNDDVRPGECQSDGGGQCGEQVHAWNLCGEDRR